VLTVQAFGGSMSLVDPMFASRAARRLSTVATLQSRLKSHLFSNAYHV